MDFDRLPSRPVVKSATSAQAEWERWLYENHFQRLLDGDGIDWTLEVDVQITPSDNMAHDGKFTATLQLSADVGIDALLKTGVLDPIEDSRLIALIGTKSVPFRMRPTVHEAHGEKNGRKMISTVLPELRENIAKSRLNPIKRTLIGRWIDDQGVFGASQSV